MSRYVSDIRASPGRQPADSLADMKLGLNLGYWGTGNDADNIVLAKEADRIGYSVVWAAEAYGSDAATVLSWVGALTQDVDLGSAVMQIPARTPAMTAMTAATLDTLSGGRFRLGLGVSGPQVSEGWHGVKFDAPLGRTREYVDIVRMALRRETVAYQGTHWTLPLPDGPGKALKMTIHPVRAQLPIYLAAVGPKNLELAGEIADGWLAVFFSPEHSGDLLASLKAGRATADRGTEQDRLAGFDIVPTVPVILNDDLEWRPPRCAPTPRSTSAGWDRGRRTSTTPWPYGWASRRGLQGFRISSSPGSTARLLPQCRWTSSTRPP